MMSRRTSINVVSTVLLQLVTIVSGFIIPRLILENFGSDVNGLISSLTQFLNYISLIEGGVSSVIMASLYTPLYEKNHQKINSILVAANNFFKKIAYIFLAYMLIVAILYPVFIQTTFDWNFIFTLTLILGVSLFIQYYFSLTWRLLLQADQKVYVASAVQILVIIVNTVLTVIAIRFSDSIHIVKLIAAFAFVLQPIIFNMYIDKKYKVDLSVQADNQALSQRWDGFGINIAAFLHGNTDVIVLTVFSTLKNVSIYSVYSLVATGIKSLIVSISSGLVPTLGNSYAQKDTIKLNKMFSFYEILIFLATFTIYTCAAVLIVPFVLVYTKGVTDANYNQALFSILLIFSMAMFCLREPYVNMAYCAGKFKEVSKYAYVEAIINIVVSISLVYFFGLNGVALGTFCSMTYRTLCQVYYLKKNVIYRKPIIFYKKFFIIGISSVIGYLVCIYLFSSSIELSWMNWIIYAFKNAMIITGINVITIFVFFKKDLKREG